MSRFACAAVLLLAAGSLLGQPVFEVATVKVDTVGVDEGPGKGREIVQPTPGGLTMRNIRLRSALKWAYSLQTDQVAGPAWIDSERYVIIAKAGVSVVEEQLRLMLQSLLTERFRLTSHWDRKEATVFVLRLGDHGPKLKPAQENADGENGVRYGQGYSVIGTQATLSQLADSLTNPLHTVVLDETGLRGHFDFALDLNSYRNADAANEDMPALVARGLQEQLGVKLESRKSPIRVLVVTQRGALRPD